jgi:hypothetical protein
MNNFRDITDYIHYFQETIGSTIDGVAITAHRGKLILNRNGYKAPMMQVTSRSDQMTRATPEFIVVGIPKIHRAFYSANDSPFIADALSASISLFKEKPAAAWRGGEAVTSVFDNPTI